MIKQKSIKVNFVMNAILTMSQFLFPLITFPYVSRVLLPAGTGKVSFAISVVTYFLMIAQLGIPTYGIRACAKVRDQKEELSRTVQEILMINLFMSVIAYLLFIAALFHVNKLSAEKNLFLIVSMTIWFNAIGMEWFYKATEQYSYITMRSIAFKLIALAAMFFLVKDEQDYVIYGAISIFASSASNVLNFIHIRKFITMRPVGNYCLKRHWKAIAVFFAMSCATTIYTNLDTAMLGFMKSDEDVGYYNAAVKIKCILVSIVTSLGTVLLPRASYYVEHGLKEEFYRITNKAVHFVFLIAAPMMAYFIVFAKEGVLFLSGNAYEKAVIPMQIIMPTLLFIGFSNVLGIQMLIPLGKEKIVLYSEIAGAGIDLILNIILIPKYASAGAAVGTVLAEAGVFVFQYIYLRDQVRDTFINLRYGLVLAAIAAGCAASGWTLFLPIGNFPKLLISALLFFTIYSGILLWRKEELTCQIIGEIFTKILKFRKR